jgi:hypothetical protein
MLERVEQGVITVEVEAEAVILVIRVQAVRALVV